jgi:serine/threonine protein phosphatase PrpC
MVVHTNIPERNRKKNDVDVFAPQHLKDYSTSYFVATKINQDQGVVGYPYGNHPKSALFAVYDGHGQWGELVGQFALHEIQWQLEKHAQFHTNLESAFKETFVAVDEALITEPLTQPLFAGTTACVALLKQTKLTLANAGDSRAVCAKQTKKDNGSYMAFSLTKDQHPNVPEEMKRILRWGGNVSLPPASGLSARVWLDPNCTKLESPWHGPSGTMPSQSGVIAEPIVMTHTVTPEDDFLMFASDGVWEFMTSVQHAVQIMGESLHRGATKSCQALIEAAVTRWHKEEGAYRDDIIAIVVQLQRLWDNNTSSNGGASSNPTAAQAAKK